MLHLGVGGAGIAVAQVLAHRGVKQVALLRDDPQMSAIDASVRSRTSWPSILHRALGDVVQPRDQKRDRRLPGAAGTDERRELPRLDAKARRRARPTCARDPRRAP